MTLHEETIERIQMYDGTHENLHVPEIKAMYKRINWIHLKLSEYTIQQKLETYWWSNTDSYSHSFWESPNFTKLTKL